MKTRVDVATEPFAPIQTAAPSNRDKPRHGPKSAFLSGRSEPDQNLSIGLRWCPAGRIGRRVVAGVVVAIGRLVAGPNPQPAGALVPALTKGRR